MDNNRIHEFHLNLLLYSCISILFLDRNSMAASVEMVTAKNHCYSCASENMKENFLTRERGPSGRKNEPKLYDSMCDLDSWLIREKSAIECKGPCFKWQQVLNNSGVLSYATIRDCFERMFDASVSPTPSAGPFMTECKHVESKLDCLDQSSVEESTCYCMGDFCNFALKTWQMSFGLLLMMLFLSFTIIFINHYIE